MTIKRRLRQFLLVLTLAVLGWVGATIAAPAPISLHTSVGLPVDI